MESKEVLMYQEKKRGEGRHTPMQLPMCAHLLFHHVAEQQQVHLSQIINAGSHHVLSGVLQCCYKELSTYQIQSLVGKAIVVAYSLCN